MTLLQQESVLDQLRRHLSLRLALSLFTGFLLTVSLPHCLTPAAVQAQPLTSSEQNGKAVYTTGENLKGVPVKYRIGRGPFLEASGVTCLNCHRVDGAGGELSGAKIPAITPDRLFNALGKRPPYTEELLKRTITEGIDPAGSPLKPIMPRWQISQRDLDDLVAYLKRLSREPIQLLP